MSNLSRVTLFILFVTVLQTVLCRTPGACQKCLQSSSCKPPDCFCCRDELRLPNLALTQIPQIVFFTFDDAVTEQVAGFYQKLFHESRKNPNGCPISMTLFISHENTKYRLVAEFYRKGMEIASHSVTHSTMNGSNFYQEAKAQKENLAKLAGVPIHEIKGWRSPFLKPTGDLQPDALKKLGYDYDATLTFSKRSYREKPPGPFTLDFGYPYECQVKPCPKHKHPGFWEVPVVSLLDYKQAYDCVYVDGCMNAPPDEDKAYQFLWDNFHNYYTTTKMPFGINMHPSWFYYPDRLKAMDRFIQKLASLNDVYIISANRMLEWLKRPTPLQDLHSFAPWACDGSEKAFKNGPRVVKTNLPPPPPPRSFISWTRNPPVTNYTPSPASRQRMFTQTRLFTPHVHRNGSTHLRNGHSNGKHLFTLDLSKPNRRQQTQQWNNPWIQKQTKTPQVSSRDQSIRMRTRRPEIPPPAIPLPRLTQQQQLKQHEERLRRRRILEEKLRQKEILEQRQRQQRHQELLEQQRQQELADKRQLTLQQQTEGRSQQRILWKPPAITPDVSQDKPRQTDNRWNSKVHQETVKLWPLVNQPFSVPAQGSRERGQQTRRRPSRTRERPKDFRNRQVERFNTRRVANSGVSSNLQKRPSPTSTNFIDPTAAAVPVQSRINSRLTESPRHLWYTDMRSRFGPITNGPRFSRGGSNRRPGIRDPSTNVRTPTNPLKRTHRMQAQHIPMRNTTRPRQINREDRVRQQRMRDIRARRVNPDINNRINDLTVERPPFIGRELPANDVRAENRGMFTRNVLHPTVAQHLAWNSFIRQMLGPH